MGKERHLDTSAGIIKAFGEAKIECTPVIIKMTPRLRRMQKDVENFVRGIEKAHRKAAKSKLIFHSPLVSNLQPSNS